MASNEASLSADKELTMFDFFIFLCVASVWGIVIWSIAHIWANFKRGTVNIISEAIDKSNKSFRK